MRILVVTPFVPYPVSGAPTRAYYLINNLLKEGNKIAIVGYYDISTEKYIQELREKWKISMKFLKVPAPLKFLTRIKIILTQKIPPSVRLYSNNEISNNIYQTILEFQPQVILLEELFSYFMIRNIIDKISEYRIIVDFHNVYHKMFEEETKSLSYHKMHEKFLRKIVLSKLKKLEIEAIKKANLCFVVSKSDKTFLKKYVDENKIVIVPNGATCSDLDVSSSNGEDIILFMGNLGYFANEDGIKYYLKKIHPKIRQHFGEVKLYIIGKNCPDWLRRENMRDEIHVLGFVDDITEYLSKAKVCIAPLRFGSGTRLKILEYMAMGKSVVSTKKGAEGLEVFHGRNILIAEDSKDFARFVCMLIENEKLTDDIGKNAKKLVEEKYDWKNITKKANMYLKQVIGGNIENFDDK